MNEVRLDVKTMRHLIVVAILGVLVSCLGAEAGMENVRFALHRTDTFTPTKAIPFLCDDLSTETVEPNYSPTYTQTSCWEYNGSRAPLGASQVYIVVVRAGQEGVAAASFGINYEGRAGQSSGIDPDRIVWTPCSGRIQFPNDGGNGDFPAPGGGLRITWTNCDRTFVPRDGVDAVVGSLYVYAYSDDTLYLTPNNNLQGGPELAVADCEGETTDLLTMTPPGMVWLRMGYLGFGNRMGYDACSDVFQPASRTTWGILKHLYEAGR